MEGIDNDNVTSPIILNNTRVLPVPAKSGSTEQSHSNDNTKGNTGIGLDLERDALQSQATPSVLAPSLHTPKVEIEKVDEESTIPIDDENSDIIPNNDETLPIVEEISELAYGHNRLQPRRFRHAAGPKAQGKLRSHFQ